MLGGNLGAAIDQRLLLGENSNRMQRSLTSWLRLLVPTLAPKPGSPTVTRGKLRCQNLGLNGLLHQLGLRWLVKAVHGKCTCRWTISKITIGVAPTVLRQTLRSPNSLLGIGLRDFCVFQLCTVMHCDEMYATSALKTHF
jgi:hypothetical protein